MRTKVKAFFDAQTGKLNRTVIPEPHEHDNVLHPHLPEPGEVEIFIPMGQFLIELTLNDDWKQPNVPAMEAYFAKVRT